VLSIWPEAMTVHLHKAPVDFRKQINGLSVIVSEAMAIDPFKPALFVFTNRNRDRVKILYWDKNGFCLWQKRLEKQRFVWPLLHDHDVVELTGDQLNWLVAGYDVFRFPPSDALKFTAVT